MAEPDDQQGEWKYVGIAKTLTPEKAEPLAGSEEDRTLTGLRAVVATAGSAPNPFLPIEPPEPPKQNLDTTQRLDFMPPGS